MGPEVQFLGLDRGRRIWKWPEELVSSCDAVNPSRAAIHAAVEGLRGLEGSPSMFQRLAESYAQRMFPQRFGRLVPRGINPEGIAVRGWPDAYAVRPDGRIDVLEATLDRDWRRHLKRDLKNALEAGTGKIAGFVLVAWEPVPDAEEEVSLRRRFAAEVGVRFDDVILIFSRQLARDLCHPRFAPLWADPLRLPGTCEPFARIREVEGLFGKEGSAEAFAPALAEYEAGVIHRPALIGDVEERLRGHHWAWVRGRGATGKTGSPPEGVAHPQRKASVFRWATDSRGRVDWQGAGPGSWRVSR